MLRSVVSWSQLGPSKGRGKWEVGQTRRLRLTVGAGGLQYHIDDELRLETTRMASRLGLVGLQVAGAQVTFTRMRLRSARLEPLDAAQAKSPRPASHQPRVVCFPRTLGEFKDRVLVARRSGTRFRDAATSTGLGLGLCLRRTRGGVIFSAGLNHESELIGGSPSSALKKRTARSWLRSKTHKDRVWELTEGLDLLEKGKEDLHLIELGSLTLHQLRRYLRQRVDLLGRAVLVSPKPHMLKQAALAWPKARLVYLHGKSPSEGRDLVSELPKQLGRVSRKAILTRLEYLNPWRVAAVQRAGWQVYALADPCFPEDLAAAWLWRLDGLVRLGLYTKEEETRQLSRVRISTQEGPDAKAALAKLLVGWGAGSR